MKRLIWMIFITLLTAGVAAQTKVVERSAKKVPGWLNTAVEDYLVVSVTAGSLAEGQTKALTEITERIIQSVASNVTVSNADGDGVPVLVKFIVLTGLIRAASRRC